MGIVGGVLLRMADLSPEQIDLLGFLGELMLRLLKMLVLPLVAGSMVAGEHFVPYSVALEQLRVTWSILLFLNIVHGPV